MYFIHDLASPAPPAWPGRADIVRIMGNFIENNLAGLGSMVHNDRDDMSSPRRHRLSEDAKAAALRAAGALHPHPERVQDDAFARHEFFDRRDRVQVKYEMLRRHRVDGRPVTAVAAAFGASRQTFYVTNAAFTTGGLPGLLPRPRGPQRAHKCTDAILDFVAQWRAEHEPAAWLGVADAVRRRFHVTIHPRSLARALARREKKPRPPGAAQP
jgi:transposase